MGQLELQIPLMMRSADYKSQLWTTEKVADALSGSSALRDSSLRHTRRLLDRWNAIPRAITLEQFYDDVPSEYRRLKVEQAVNAAKYRRVKIFLVQFSEVRLGVWALVWNNLRQARYWMWIQSDSLGTSTPSGVAVKGFLQHHQGTTLLLFDRSARHFRDNLVEQCGLSTELSTTDFVLI